MTGQNFRNFVGGLDRDGENEVVGNLENFKLVRDQLKVLASSSPTDEFNKYLCIQLLCLKICKLTVHYGYWPETITSCRCHDWR